MLKLYTAPGTCALATHIALAEAGAPYTVERLDFKNNQQNSPEYLKINPKGRVPTLVTEHGVLTETPAMLAYVAQTYPQARRIIVEDKANGSAVIEALRADLSGILAVTPEGGKESRANAVQGIVAGGGVLLPDETHAKYDDGRRGAPWVPVLVHEAVTFPRGETDDQVDTLTQHLNAVAGSFAARLKAAMAKS